MTTLSISQQALSHSYKEINAISTLQLWMDRYAQRKQLMQLSDMQLVDIGLSRKEANIEAKRPFWS